MATDLHIERLVPELDRTDRPLAELGQDPVIVVERCRRSGGEVADADLVWWRAAFAEVRRRELALSRIESA